MKLLNSIKWKPVIIVVVVLIIIIIIIIIIKKHPNVPYLYQSCLNKNQPFGYEDSNLKNLYLSREQLATIKAEPITFKLQ